MADDATFWIDRWGAPVRIDNALHQTTVLKRNAASATPALVVYDSSFDAGVTSLTYNARGNLTIDSTRYVGDALGVRTTVWRYTAANAPDSPDLVTDPAGFQTAYSYDTQGLTTLVWAPNLHKTTYQYLGSTDSLHGLLSAVVDSFVPTWKDSIKVNAHLKTQFTFDLLGNVIKTVSPSGRIDSMGRDTLERVVNAYDGAGHRTEYAYDPANRIRSVKVHVEQAGIRNPAAYPADSGAVAALETKYYFTLGLLDSVSDPRQVPRGFRYDPAGRTIKQIGEAHDTVFTWYNPAGQTDSVRLRTGAKIRNVWDTAGRLVASKFPYDATHKDSTAYGYDAANRVITIRRMRTGDTTSIRRTWYPTGQMQSELDSIGITTMTQTAVYNAAGYRTQLIVSRDGSRATTDSIGYTYADASGNPTGIRVHWRNSATDADSVDNVQLTWDPLGRRDQVLFPLINDTVFFAYDSNSIQRVVCSNGGGGYLNGVMYQQNVDLDGLINQTKSVIPNKGLGRHCAGSWSEVADSATYDVRHQMLVQRAYSQPVIDYRYDGSGNRTREWARGTGYQEPRRDEVMAANSNRLLSASRHDASNVLITNNYYYNLDGSRRQDDECNPGGCAAIQLFQYDSLGRAALMADLGGALGTCSYDPLGRIAVS
ncbi:MAG: hypothetical protein ABJC74_13380, partial [Gemmatimonadota bacterium]